MDRGQGKVPARDGCQRHCAEHDELWLRREIEEASTACCTSATCPGLRKIGHPSEVIKKGQQLQCVVLAVDEEKMRVALGLKQLSEDPGWRQIPDHYLPGQIVRGKVTRSPASRCLWSWKRSLGLLPCSELAE